MYAPKALIALALAGAAVPALAQSFEPLTAREGLSLVARNVNFVRSVGESLGMKRSEIDYILARELHHKQHGAKHHARAESRKATHKAPGRKHGHKQHKTAKPAPSPAHNARALLARQGASATPAVQSGALSFKEILDGAGSVISAILRRDDAANEQSGAINWHNVLHDAGEVASDVGTVASVVAPFLRREGGAPMMARSFDDLD